jgi:hypothetical protein
LEFNPFIVPRDASGSGSTATRNQLPPALWKGSRDTGLDEVGTDHSGHFLIEYYACLNESDRPKSEETREFPGMETSTAVSSSIHEMQKPW